MFKSQNTTLAIGFILFVAYIWAFGAIFNLDYHWIFYILAILLAGGFFAFTSDYYPKTEVYKSKQKFTSGARCIRDWPYTWASLGAIALFLISVTPLLVTIYWNQSGIREISWLSQALVFVGGYVLQYVSILLYNLPDSTPAAGEAWYSDFWSRPRTNITTEELNRKIDEVTQLTIPQQYMDEAKLIVDFVLPKVLHIEKNKIHSQFNLKNEVLFDEIDLLDIETEICQLLSDKYGRDLPSMKHFAREKPFAKVYIDACADTSALIELGYKPKNSDYLKKIYDAIETVQDLYDLVGSAIYYFKNFN